MDFSDWMKTYFFSKNYSPVDTKLLMGLMGFCNRLVMIGPVHPTDIMAVAFYST